MRVPSLIMLGALLSQASCSSEGCTEIGCTSSAVIAGEMPVPSGAVTVKACRNQSCTTLADAAAEDCKLAQGTPRIEVCFSSASATTLKLDAIVYHDVDSAALANGDVYSLEVTDASGASLVSFTGNASYEDYRPNGAGCDPVCKSAELSF